MISLTLAAGYATRMYPLTEHFPKPLLPVGGASILERLMLDMDQIEDVTGHVVVTNHRFIAPFQQWKAETGAKKQVELLDDGSTENRNRLGAVNDILLAIDRLNLDDDLLVVAGDNLLDFSLSALVEPFRRRRTSCVMCYHEPELSVLRRCGVATLDADFNVLSMAEKPERPESHWAVPPFYIYARQDLPLIRRAIRCGVKTDAPGSLMAWLCQAAPVLAVPMPGSRVDVGDLEGYEKIRESFNPQNR